MIRASSLARPAWRRLPATGKNLPRATDGGGLRLALGAFKNFEREPESVPSSPHALLQDAHSRALNLEFDLRSRLKREIFMADGPKRARAVAEAFRDVIDLVEPTRRALLAEGETVAPLSAPNVTAGKLVGDLLVLERLRHQVRLGNGAVKRSDVLKLMPEDTSSDVEPDDKLDVIRPILDDVRRFFSERADRMLAAVLRNSLRGGKVPAAAAISVQTERRFYQHQVLRALTLAKAIPTVQTPEIAGAKLTMKLLSESRELATELLNSLPETNGASASRSQRKPRSAKP